MLYTLTNQVLSHVYMYVCLHVCVLCVSQVLVPPGYGEDVKTWPAASILPPEAVKESPMVLYYIILQMKQYRVTQYEE